MGGTSLVLYHKQLPICQVQTHTLNNFEGWVKVSQAAAMGCRRECGVLAGMFE